MSRAVWSGGSLLAPVPACLITCAYEDIRNVFTVAWAGTVCTKPAITYISVRPTRFSYDLIAQSGVFVINLVTKRLARAADWCGVKSGRDVDKFAELALETEISPALGLPQLVDSPVCIECRVREIKPLGSHDMFLADVAGISVDEALIDKSGALRLEKAGLAAYAHGAYFALGERLGAFGFSVKKNKKRKDR